MTMYPPFSLEKQRFDQSTYEGRLYRCFDVVDPRTLFISADKLSTSLKLLEDFKNGKRSSLTTDAELWQAKKVKEAIYHPDTGEKIFMPLRMSGYVPFGVITVVGMLLPGASVKQVLFWQWLNQSHNACVNYANRNATKETPTSRFIASYVGAVTSAVTIGVGMSLLIKNTKRLSPANKLFASRFVAYPATSCANICNVYMMRQNELKEGVEVEDADGNVVGTSKVAAKKAVFETAISRVILPAPVLIAPPIIMHYLNKMKFMRSSPRLDLAMNAFVCTVSFGLALPFCIALFPQRSKIAVTDIESEIATKTTARQLYFNKGL